MIMRIPILKSILRNLDWFEEARRHHVAPDGSILLGGTNHRLKKDGDWEESKHPRADNGQFGSGSGTSRGGSKKPKPSKTKRKMERRAEAAGQARVGGAIQSLLSGGSALDKVSWFKQPETPAKDPEKPNAKPNATQEKPTEGKPEKPKAEEKPKPADKVTSAKDTIQENLRSGKLKRETVIAAVMSLQEQARAVKAKGDFESSKDLMFQANVMIDAAEIKSHELIPSKRQNAPPHKPTNTQRNPGNDPFAGDPLHDPVPRGYGVRSPEETERYMREHPYKPPKKEDYESEYKRRTGRDWDPTTA